MISAERGSPRGTATPWTRGRTEKKTKQRTQEGDTVTNLYRGHAIEGLFTGEKLPQEDSKGVDISGRGIRLMADHLGGHPTVCPGLT